MCANLTDDVIGIFTWVRDLRCMGGKKGLRHKLTPLHGGKKTWSLPDRGGLM